MLGSLLVSPVLGFVGALLLFQFMKCLVHDKHLYEPPKDGQPPVWWMRAILILTCSSVSYAHGTNDGQKSIGLIMLTIIGLMPATYAINTTMTSDDLAQNARVVSSSADLIARYGDDEKALGTDAARHLGSVFGPGPSGLRHRRCGAARRPQRSQPRVVRTQGSRGRQGRA